MDRKQHLDYIISLIPHHEATPINNEQNKPKTGQERQENPVKVLLTPEDIIKRQKDRSSR